METTTNLFGEEIPAPDRQPKRGPTPHQQMLRLYGQKRGFVCRDCKHLVATGNNATYYKCSKFGVTSGAATDWRLKWAACGLFQWREER